MRMKKALEIEYKAWKHKAAVVRACGYKPIEEDGVEWLVCPEHMMAHPVDFPCKMCVTSNAESEAPK